MEQREMEQALKTLEMPEYLGQLILAIRDLVEEHKQTREATLTQMVVDLQLLRKGLESLREDLKQMPVMRVQAVTRDGIALPPGYSPYGS